MCKGGRVPSGSTPKRTQHHIALMGTRIGVVHEKCIGVWTQDIRGLLDECGAKDRGSLWERAGGYGA